MPTAQYNKGFRDAVRLMQQAYSGDLGSALEVERTFTGPRMERTVKGKYKPKRKLSAWNKYVKANSNKPRVRYRNGKLNLKKNQVRMEKKISRWLLH